MHRAPRAIAFVLMLFASISVMASACHQATGQRDSAGTLTDAERRRTVDSVVPDAPFRPTTAMCENRRGPKRDARGEVHDADPTGVSIAGPGCLVGAKVIGTFGRGLGWAEVKRHHDGDGIRWSRPEPGLVHVIGSYIDNVEDAIGPPKSPDADRAATWKVEHVYARYTRDDFIENDACLDGHVHDSLIDGTHVFISARPGRSNRPKMAKHEAMHTITNTLIWLDCKPDPRVGSRSSCPKGQSTMIPFKWSECGGIVNMQDSIIRVDARAFRGSGPMSFPPGTYENVWLIYLGPEDEYPGGLPASGVTQIKDDELWRVARQKWLKRHGCDTTGDHCTMVDK